MMVLMLAVLAVLLHSAVASEACADGNQAGYRGKLSVTNTGLKCQRWDSQSPHKHSATPAKYPNSGLEENFCRNPDGDTTPDAWCYTEDKGTRWQFCDVPRCDGSAVDLFDADQSSTYCNAYWDCGGCTGVMRCWPASLAIDGSRSTQSRTGRQFFKNPYWWQASMNDTLVHQVQMIATTATKFGIQLTLYKGDRQVGQCGTHNGQKGQRLQLHDCDRVVADRIKLTMKNYNYHSQQWYIYYLRVIGEPKEYVDCVSTSTTYRGATAVTASGRKCQAWASQSPHWNRWYTPEQQPDKGLDANYCRNPSDNSGGLWCYTTDPKKRWEYCSVPQCAY